MDTKDEKEKSIDELENAERNIWEKDESMYKYLYPSLNDIYFNKKIAEKREFNDTRYNGEILDIEKEAVRLCNSDFELSPYQQFIKNFLSLYTPYNSLLLFHGLGSGKTCSAIGVAEEMRDYIKHIGLNHRIIIVASPNVQANFRLQLFDENKLELVDGLWNIKSCTGNKLLREINPLNMTGLTKERVITLIKNLINAAYLFLGYTEFANYIEKKSHVPLDLVENPDKLIKQKLKEIFDNRLIIIDEVHNIRDTDENKGKRVATQLLKLVKNADNIRLLLLSATPLYNSYKEIIWLINLMNLNDRRSTINIKDVFDSQGNFIKSSDGKEIGKELLARKATGYVSFVRGDNPYTFPYKVYPNEFAPSKTITMYPRTQINGKNVDEPLNFLSIYMVSLSGYQNLGYNYIVNKLSSTETMNIENMEQLGYIQLTNPLQALNIVYPNIDLTENNLDAEVDVKKLVGKEGLKNVVTYTESNNPPSKKNFKYTENILETFGPIFSPENIGSYSSKIKAICDNIKNSEGVVLIYSQYLDGGVVPIALALEEMGITRYGSTSSLFAKPPIENLDLNTYTNTNKKDSVPAKYIMITGDTKLSPNNAEEVKAATQKENINGNKVKVVLISQAGSEGIDFKFIRQVNILEPWYNLSRIEQIIGRAVRNCSHKLLPLEERNVQIFLYGSELLDNIEEAADLYVYRLAEKKSIKIGKVTRVLKEYAIDCLLNSEQNNFNSEIMKVEIKQKLSDGQILNYKVGDREYTAQCDFMETCMYKCKPINEIDDINQLTYSKNFVEMNFDRISNRIRQLMKEKYFYKKKDFIREINAIRKYPLEQIYSTLTYLINNKNEIIYDKYNREGHLINIDDYYFFQPIELTDNNISIFERSVPIPFKNSGIKVNIDELVSISEAQVLKIAPVLQKVAEEVGEDDIDKKTVNKLNKTIEKSEDIKKQVLQPVTKKPINIQGIEIINKMLADYNTSNTKQIIVRGEKDVWYKYSYFVLKELQEMGISKEVRDNLLISNLIEMNLYDNLVNILNYIYFKEELSDFENKIKKYFDNYLLKDKGLIGILLPSWDSKKKKSIQKLMIQKENEWHIAEAEDYKDLFKNIKSMVVAKTDINNMYGFISNFKNNIMIFKFKDNKPGKTGARCDQGSKLTADKLNDILEKDIYSEAYIKKQSASYLCVLEEYLLRLNNYNKKNSKRWFLTPVEAIFNSN